MNILSVTDGTASLILPPYVDFRSDEDKRRYERKLRLLKDPEGKSLQDAKDNLNAMLAAQRDQNALRNQQYGLYGQFGLYQTNDRGLFGS